MGRADDTFTGVQTTSCGTALRDRVEPICFLIAGFCQQCVRVPVNVFERERVFARVSEGEFHIRYDETRARRGTRPWENTVDTQVTNQLSPFGDTLNTV